jgi:hypothetical protein
MLRELDRAVARLSALLLLAGFLIIGAGLLELESGPVIFGPLLAVAVALWLARDAIPVVQRYPRWALSDLGSELWLTPLVAASVVIAAPGATPGELQAIGGLVGLAALLIFVLRPLYRLLVRLWWWATDQSQ